MHVNETIRQKRDGLELSTAQIDSLIRGFVDARVPDFQMAAFLMAVYFKGMTEREAFDLTMAMADSGDRVDLSVISGLKVDKHSTGGVGDKTTLVLAPLVASCGGIVAKMTGRELGHTGGTVDKLESIPGFEVELSQSRFIEVVKEIHVSLTAQTDRLAPADKKIYALRNLTATVEAVALMASSIMSKKLAAGADAIVLDVKTGRGAFTQSYGESIYLAKAMVDIGAQAGRRMAAWITGMDQPLGRAVGNALEVREAIDTLRGEGPDDLVELITELGSDMLFLSEVVSSREAGRSRIAENISNREGLARLADLIAAQGGDPAVLHNPDLLPQPRVKLDFRSETSGYVCSVDALEIGLASKLLGAGRRAAAGGIDHAVGIYLNKKTGDRVRAGDCLAVLHSDGDENKIGPATEKLKAAYAIGVDKVAPGRLIRARLTKQGIEER